MRKKLIEPEKNRMGGRKKSAKEKIRPGACIFCNSASGIVDVDSFFSEKNSAAVSEKICDADSFCGQLRQKEGIAVHYFCCVRNSWVVSHISSQFPARIPIWIPVWLPVWLPSQNRFCFIFSFWPAEWRKTAIRMPTDFGALCPRISSGNSIAGGAWWVPKFSFGIQNVFLFFQTCAYCKLKGATIGCCVRNCRISFHLNCGRRNGTFHQISAGEKNQGSFWYFSAWEILNLIRILNPRPRILDSGFWIQILNSRPQILDSGFWIKNLDSKFRLLDSDPEFQAPRSRIINLDLRFRFPYFRSLFRILDPGSCSEVIDFRFRI